MAGISKRLNFILSASANGFTTALQKAERAVQAVAKRGGAIAGELNTRMGSALTAFGAGAGAAAIGGVTLLVRMGLRSADELQALSQQLGIATDKLAGLQWAAKLANVDQEQLTAGLQKMQGTIGKAANGNKAAADSLALIGLSAQELVTLSPDKQIALIGDKLAAIPNVAQRAAAASAIFGRQAGPGMAALLSRGSKALQEAAGEAASFGFNLSQLDAEKLNVVNDNFDRLEMAVTAVAQQLANGLAPIIDVVLEQILGFGKEAQKSGGIAGVAAAMTTDALAFLGDTLDAVTLGWIGFRNLGTRALQGLLWPIEKLLQGVQWLVDTFEDYLPDAVVNGVRSSTEFIEGFRDDLNADAEDLAAEFQERFVAPSMGDKFVAAFRRAQQKMNETAKEETDHLQEKIDLQQAFLGLKDEEEKKTKTKATKERAEPKVDQSLKLFEANTDAFAKFQFELNNSRDTVAEEQLDAALAANDKLDDIARNTENMFEIEEVEF